MMSNKINAVIMYEDITYIITDDKQVIIVYTSDYLKYELYNYYWRVNGHGYAVACIKDKHISLHRLIMESELEKSEKKIIDHKNHNKLDNRYCKDGSRYSNLRLVTNKQNMRNCKMCRGNVVGCKGVAYDRNYKGAAKWKYEIKHNGRYIQERCYTKGEAIIGRIIGELRYYGEYAYVDFTSKSLEGVELEHLLIIRNLIKDRPDLMEIVNNQIDLVINN